LFDNLKEDLRPYPTFTNPIRWMMIWCRFGKWVDTIRFNCLRVILDKIYWIFQSILSTVTTIHFDRRLSFGKNFHIIHPISIVIHPDVLIGNNVGIMHEVTIGTRGSTGAPRIGNDVFIGAGAKIIGNITIGDNVDIGANAVVLTDVPANSLVVGNPGRIINKE
jgi:serine O-acetyltransferase